jgi:hypothetical protein
VRPVFVISGERTELLHFFLKLAESLFTPAVMFIYIFSEKDDQTTNHWLSLLLLMLFLDIEISNL